MSDIGKYYTYVHCRKDNGHVFYVGKGVARRAWNVSKRNIYWKRVNEKYGNIVKIVKYFDDEQAAFRHEMELIKLFRGCGFELTNLTRGGEGTSGFKMSDEQRIAASERVKLYYQDPSNVKKLSEGIKKYYKDNPTAAIVAGERQRNWYTQPQNKKLVSDIRKQFYEENPDALKTLRAKNKAYYDDPINLEKHSLLKKQYYSDPANIQKLKDAKSNLHFLHLPTNQEFFSYNEAGRVLDMSHTTVKKRLLIGKEFVDLQVKTENTDGR